MPAMGYDPVRAGVARIEMMTTGRYVRIAPSAAIPPAMSLSKYRYRHLEQGQVGTCWIHAPTALVEFSSTVRGFQTFAVCRRLTAYRGKQLEGGGNPADGGSGLDALKAMSSTADGVGIAHEDLWPYLATRHDLATKPPQSVYDDAQQCHLTAPVDVQSLAEAKTLIAAGHPVCIGVWCPNNWVNSQTFFDTVGGGSYGHEVLVIGYANAGVIDSKAWYQIENWWGLLYPPLSTPQAALVSGYVPVSPAKTADFWISEGALATIIGKGNAELASAIDLSGIPGGPDPIGQTIDITALILGAM